MFCGYGGASFGLLKANIDFECIGISEIDKYAIQCFNNNFPNIKNFGDCSKIDINELPDFDLLTGGFPCQDVSVAGNRDLTKGRTNLYKEVLRIAEAKKPKYILLENVKGLLSMEVEEQKLVDIIVRDLKKLGYGVIWKVLNSKDYGIPQNRERIWFVCKLGGWNFMEFQFPQPIKLKIFLKDILEKEFDKKYYLSEKMINSIIRRKDKDVPQPHLIGLNDNEIGVTITTKAGGRYQDNFVINKPITCDVDGNEIPNVPEIGEANRVYLDNGIAPTIKGNINIKTRNVQEAINVVQDMANKEDKPVQIDLYHLQSGEIRPLSTYIPQELDVHRCLQAGEPKEVLIEPYLVQKHHTEELREYKEGVCPTIGSDMGGDSIRVVEKQINTIRKLTPREAFRLMGFLNDEINLEGISDSRKYHLAGNGWDVNLVSKIFKEMFKDGRQNNTKEKS